MEDKPRWYDLYLPQVLRQPDGKRTIIICNATKEQEQQILAIFCRGKKPKS